MNGFFSEAFFTSIAQPNCKGCGLNKTCLTPKMGVTGKGEKKIFVIAEAPGEEEDKRGIQLIGECGQLFRDILKENLGLNLDRDCWKMNAVNCRPPKNKTPKNKEIIACRPYVLSELQLKKPKLILLLGNVAVASVIGSRWKKKVEGVKKWRGTPFYDPHFKSYISCTYHPSFLLRKDDPALDLVFTKDIRRAISVLDNDPPELITLNDCKDRVSILTEPKAGALLNYIVTGKSKRSLFAFDYETTGIKPYSKGHAIVYCSICFDRNKSYCFVMTERLLPLFKRFAENPDLKKIASNMKYETVWSKVIKNIAVKGWIWDTMLVAHTLDNRSGITGLKYQVYTQFGIPDYEELAGDAFKTKNSNDINRIMSLSSEEHYRMMIYCGLDSLFEYNLALNQMKKMGFNSIKDLKGLHL